MSQFAPDDFDAASEEASKQRQIAIDESIKADEGFAWRWRVRQALETKFNNRSVRGWTKRDARSLRYMEKYTDAIINECLDANADAASLSANPLAYYGMRPSDFI